MDIAGKQGFLSGRIEMRNYRYVQKYRIMNPPTTDGYAVPFTLNYIPGSDPYFRDIQPVSNGIALPFWIEHAAGTTISTNTPYVSPKIWVRLPKGCTDIEMYRTSPKMSRVDRSDGDRTFDLFDDFLGTSLNTDKWTPTVAGKNTIANSEIAIANTAQIINLSNTTFGVNYSTISRTKSIIWDTSTTLNPIIGFRQNPAAGNHFAIFYRDWPTANKLQCVQGDNTGTYPTTNFTNPGNNLYHIFEVSRLSSGNIYTINRSETHTISTYVTTSSIPVSVGADFSAATNPLYYDWVAVRKYQSPEPTPVLQGTMRNPLWFVH